MYELVMCLKAHSLKAGELHSYKVVTGTFCFLICLLCRIDNWKREHLLQYMREKVKPTSPS